MAEVVRVRDNHEGYFEILAKLFSKGTRQPSRNGETLEIEDLIIEVENPVYAAPNGVRPGYNHAIGLVEGLQLLAGVSDAALTAEIQPNFRNFIEDDTGRFWGAYGPRTRDQFPIITKRLRADPDTRQAVITLWDPEFDALGGKKDHPCTTAFFFLIRQGKLNMKTVMRSSDLWWGVPYDFVQFSMVHQSMAAVLNLPVGIYTHHSVSAHLYEPHWDAAMKTLKERKITQPPIPVPHFSGSTWGDVSSAAFTTYRVATGTLGADVLLKNGGQEIAETLMARRQAVLAANLDKLRGIQQV